MTVSFWTSGKSRLGFLEKELYPMQINSVAASPVWKYSSSEKGKTSQTAQNQKYLIFDSTPEEVVSKYNINQISEEEYGQMTRELWLN